MSQTGSDMVVGWMERNGIELTRENFIDVNWMGEPPEDWGPEHEAQIPAELREEE